MSIIHNTTDLNLMDASDTLARCLVANSQVRAVAVNLQTTWLNVLGERQLPVSIQQLLGDLCAVAPLLAATLKLDGALILQIQGDSKSPVRLIVVEYTVYRTLRAAVTLNDAINWNDFLKQQTNNQSNTLGLQQLVNAQSLGRFIVILDPTHKLPGQKAYTSLVPIVGDTVAHSIDYYMANSEQLPTKVLLASNANTCVGILIQRMPSLGGNVTTKSTEVILNDVGHEVLTSEVHDDTWLRMRYLVNTLKPEEMLSTYPVTLLRRLFWQENPVAADTQTLRFFCGCSRQKVQAMLKLLGEEEINGILLEQGNVSVNCDYCQTVYQFDPVDCAAIMAAAQSTEIDSIQ
jgi:molecular chaperone Hsp33